MAATVTLSTTTLKAPASAGATSVNVASTSGITPGLRLWIDRELMAVERLGVSTLVHVRRGVDGTAAAPHSSAAVVTIGRGDQFYAVDPVGTPPHAIPVSPYINVMTGDVWLAKGDNIGPDGDTGRWWQKVSTSYATGALGVRQSTSDPSASD